MELLPAERDARIVHTRAPLDERTLQRPDAAVVVCQRERAEALISQLPLAASWQRLYREARAHGPGDFAQCTTYILGDASAFERLSLAARMEGARSARARAQIGHCHGRSW